MTGPAVPFYKMNGIGNEIVVLDLRDGTPRPSPEQARAIAANAGTFFDQLMVVEPPRTRGTDAFMTIYNVDGSLSGACGNGTRCVGDILCAEGRETLMLETSAGLLDVRKAGDHRFSVDMGRPRLKWDEIPLSEEFADTRAIELSVGPIDAPLIHSPAVVNMGNPHAVFFVERLDIVDLAKVGPMLEHHPLFPQKANISLAVVTGEASITAKVWERGAGLTRACGSAACAIGVASARTRRTGRKVDVTLPGGVLEILWRDDDHVIMTGDTELEHKGSLRLIPGSVEISI